MRTQAEILESAKNLVIPNQSDHIRLGLELLLDIRQLLIGEKDSRMLKEVVRERKGVEEEREEMVRSKQEDIKQRVKL